MARQLESTNSYSAFFWALIFALSHLQHLVTASSQRPSLTSISPVWPFLWNNKIILKSVVRPVFTMAWISYIYAILCTTALVYQEDPGNQTQVTSLVTSTSTCWATLPVRYALSVLRQSLYSPGWPRTQIHCLIGHALPHLVYYTLKSLETRCSPKHLSFPSTCTLQNTLPPNKGVVINCLLFWSSPSSSSRHPGVTCVQLSCFCGEINNFTS